MRGDLVVNEGGGAAFELDGRRFYTLCVGEKGVNRFLLRARGIAGHASVPALGDNALLKLAPALDPARASSRRSSRPRTGSPSSRRCSARSSTAPSGAELEAAVERLRGPLAAARRATSPSRCCG